MSSIAVGARCALHPDQSAVDVCQRCGNFVCAACVEVVDEEVYCNRCVPFLARSASRRLKVVTAVVTGWIPFVIAAQALVPPSLVPRWLWWMITPFEYVPMLALWGLELRARRAAPVKGRWMVVLSTVMLAFQTLVLLAMAWLFSVRP